MLLLPDAVIVAEVREAMQAIAEGRASVALAGETCIRTLLESAQQLAADLRDPEQDDDEGALPAEPPRPVPATDTGD